MKLGDYMCAGRPTVATAVGDVTHTMQTYPIGLLSHDTPRGIARQTLKLLSDPEHCAHLGRNARRVAEDVFDWRLRTAELETLYEKVLSSWPFLKLSQRLAERRDATLIHNDAHAWNFLYPRNPSQDSVCIIDWHEWGIGLGTNDLTEMILLWWYPERRARMEKKLVRRYHFQLMEHGVGGYDWGKCWNDYRLSAIRILLYPVWMHSEGRPLTFWWPILEKGMHAFQDLGCIELLD